MANTINTELKDLPKRIPKDAARYHFFLYKHSHEGDYLESIGIWYFFFFLTCCFSFADWHFVTIFFLTSWPEGLVVVLQDLVFALIDMLLIGFIIILIYSFYLFNAWIHMQY